MACTMRVLVLALALCRLFNGASALSTLQGTHGIERRHFILSSAGIMAGIMSQPETAWSGQNEASKSLNELLARLRPIPTYCIVNPEGVPYMKINRDERLAKGYAFMSFEGGLAVLADAKRAAESGGYGEVWEDATITLIPGDVAMRLALQKIERKNRRDQTLDTTYDLIPAIENRDEALQYDKSYSDQGKVPLFFYEGLTVPGSDGGSTPLYFSKKDLVAEWKTQKGDQVAPRVKVVDLLEIFLDLIRGRSTPGLPENIFFVQSKEELKLAKELKATGLKPYKTDRMII